MTYEHLSKKKSNSKILILGKGYVGSYLSFYLLRKNFEVDIVNSDKLNYHDNKKLHNYLLNHNYDTVINCSGFTGRPNVDEAESKKEPALHVTLH